MKLVVHPFYKEPDREHDGLNALQLVRDLDVILGVYLSFILSSLLYQ